MNFLRDRPLRPLQVGLIAVWALAGLSSGIGPACAGGVNFSDDNDNGAGQGPSFFGFVRDADGPAVTATLKAGGALVTRTNTMGVYKISGFGKDIDPESVTISCAKDGYKQTSVLRRPHTAGDTADPIEVECTLQKE